MGSFASQKHWPPYGEIVTSKDGIKSMVFGSLEITVQYQELCKTTKKGLNLLTNEALHQ